MCEQAFGCTPLHAAALRGHTKCVRLLLNKGAIISATNGVSNKMSGKHVSTVMSQYAELL
jgi:ankyrin repeat protein